MNLVFVHGWSVTSLDTYAQLPQAIQALAPADLNINIQHIFLSEYISFHDEVSLDDVARAFENARIDKLGADTEFACITHSTGGPAIRVWVDLFFKGNLDNSPLSHLIMLAPANFGSSLAKLGKQKVGRIKAWFNGVEPGVEILNWLSLGSSGQWKLNTSWLDYKYSPRFLPFVLCGQTIDRAFYDFLNSYLTEKGSDGVIRLSGANINYSKLRLKQNTKEQPYHIHTFLDDFDAFPLSLDGDVQRPEPSVFQIVPNASHSGENIGIMNSVTLNNANQKPVVAHIINYLQINSLQEYNQEIENANTSNAQLQQLAKQNNDIDKYVMFVFNIVDNFGNSVKDYDMILLGTQDYTPDNLGSAFIDRQSNDLNKNLVYYMDYDVLQNLGHFGIRIIPRPSAGFTHFAPAEYRTDNIIWDFIKPNETVLVEIELTRLIATNTYELVPTDKTPQSFKDKKPNNTYID